MITFLILDATVRVASPTEAEVEEKEGLPFWNVGISKSGGVQGEGIHWRRVCIIILGETNSDGL